MTVTCGLRIVGSPHPNMRRTGSPRMSETDRKSGSPVLPTGRRGVAPPLGSYAAEIGTTNSSIHQRELLHVYQGRTDHSIRSSGLSRPIFVGPHSF